MKEKIFEILDSLQIQYQNFEHQPTFSTTDAKWVDVPGKRVKSLFLRNKKPTKYYMVVIEDEKALDSNHVRHLLWENKLSFASEERMLDQIGVRPWHVSPFALMNNKNHDVEVIFDENLRDVLIGFHPGRNDNTTVLKMQDIEKYLQHLWNPYRFLEL